MPPPYVLRCQIVDPEHPHFPEHGCLTGKMISLLGKPMAEMKLDHCPHGTDACFVSKGQVAAELRTKGTKRR